MSLTSAIVNADVALFLANVVKGTVPISLDELRLSEFLKGEMAKEDGIVKGFNFIGWTLNEVFTREASEGVYDEMWVGFGMRNLEFYGVNLYGFESTHLDHSFTEYYFPDETLSEATDSEGKLHEGYSETEVLKLLKELG